MKARRSSIKRILLSSIAALSLLANWVVTAGTVIYVYTDQQETPLAEADQAGNLTAQYDYRPFGSAYGGAGLVGAKDGPGYTGHVNDVETGLVYMQARYYDPAVGRFLAVDPDPPVPGNSFNFGRYAYTNNNPVVGTDPDGRQCAQCLYSPNDSLEHQVTINANAGVKAAAVTAVALPLIPVTSFVGATAAAVVGDTIATGSVTAGVMMNAPAVVASGGIAAEGIAAANGMPAPMNASESGAFTAIKFEEKLTKFSSNQIAAKMSPELAIENLGASGYTKTISQNGSVTVMSNSSQSYTFYPKSTGGGFTGGSTGAPSASLQVNGARKPAAKIRFEGE